MTVDLNGNYINYSAQPTNVNNTGTAVLHIKNGSLDGNASGSGRRILKTNVGTVIMENLLITGGTLGNGGALDVAAAGNLTIINSTITGNTGTTAGALLVKVGTATLINTTVTDNVASLGSSYAGVWADDGGTLYLSNSIIANTTDGAGTDINDCMETDTSEVYFLSSGTSNLIENDWDSNSNLRCDADKTNTIRNQDPNLFALVDNGGQAHTMALDNSSPAHNAGDDAAAVDADGASLTTDARGTGYSRFSGTVDLGAYEVSCEAPATPTTTFTDLDDAINVFNSDCGNGDTLTVDLGGNYINYSSQPTNVNNSTTAVLHIKDGSLDGNATGSGTPYPENQ